MLKKKPKKEPEKKFLRISDIMARYGYSRGHVGNLVNEGIFPPPMRLGTIKFWPVEIVDLFEEDLLKNYHKELEKQGFKIPDKKK